jgi:hypothetical protein
MSTSVKGSGPLSAFMMDAVEVEEVNRFLWSTGPKHEGVNISEPAEACGSPTE